jgi:predicted dehydrogenase
VLILTKMKILIAGLGSIGRRHLRNLLALGEKDLLLYRTRRATLPDEELDGFPVETDLESALARRPEAVIVANPSSLHLKVALPAAQAGCHVFLEKPISNALEGVEALRQAAAERGLKVAVGFQFRFHPGLRKVASLLAERAVGLPLAARAHWGEYLPDWHPWEDYQKGYAARKDLGGGVVLTLCHPLDYLHWLFGEVEDLWAFTGRAGLSLPVEDTAEIGLRFRSGLLGSVQLNYDQRPPLHRLEVVGNRGTIVWDNADGAVRLFAVPLDKREGEWQTFSVPDGFERNAMFLAEMQDFLDAVRGKSQPACTLEDGRRALELALAALESARTGTLQRFPAKTARSGL